MTLAALERLGGLRLYNAPSEADADDLSERPTLDLGLHTSGPDWSRARRLRKAGIDALRAVRAYATGPRCRRGALLRYFGDEARACGGCDICEGRGGGR